MVYGFRIAEEALQTLRALPKEQRRAVGYRMHLLCQDLTGDVKKLSAAQNAYRLRVGNLRVRSSGWRATPLTSKPSAAAKQLMNNLAALPGPVTLESLARAYEAQAVELAALRERIEDLEDLRELEAAEARAGGKVSRPFDPVRDLGLTSEDLAAEARKVAGEENVR